MTDLTHADGAVAPLESVVCTHELQSRPSRQPDFRTENHALVSLAQSLADSPQTILQALADTILEVLGSGSAGISLLDDKEGRFYWPAIAGDWKTHIGGGTPREFGPCGDVLDRNSPLLFRNVERRYGYFGPVTPRVHEALLVPFYVDGKAVGTIWAVVHDPNARLFDREDLRILASLGRFAASAYSAVESQNNLERQREALKDADRRKNEFLALLAHELRNPLAPISNALQIMRLEGGPAGAVPAAFRLIERQFGQIVRLVNDLLDVGRISQGKIELRVGEVEMASIVHHAVEAARPQYKDMNHELTVTLPTQPIYLRGDPIRLIQVLGNLLNNACKFTRKGGRIDLTVERDGKQAVIRLRDTGIGIASDQLERVFEMFTQADTSLERTEAGLGIGLPLVKNLVEMHGGSVQARSDGHDQGSEFVVRLPALDKPSEPAAVPTLNPPPSSSAQRILVVDDNHDSADSLAMMLKLHGNETHTAYDGREAVQAAQSLKPDVILLDIGLPKLNGYEAAREIREQPGNERMVLVALTGWGQEEDRQKSTEAGFDRHMVKPVDYTALMKLLAEPRPAS